MRLGLYNETDVELLKEFRPFYKKINAIYTPYGVEVYSIIIEMDEKHMRDLILKFPADASFMLCCLETKEAIVCIDGKVAKVPKYNIDSVLASMYNGYGENDPYDGTILSREDWEELMFHNSIEEEDSVDE